MTSSSIPRSPRGAGVKFDRRWWPKVDGLHTRNLILAMITSVVAKGGPSRAPIDPAEPSESGSGLRMPSLVLCDQLFGIRRDRVLRVSGHLSPASMGRIDGSLRIAFGPDENPS